MSWRSVVISSRCKLDYSMNYMVVRGEETRRILLDEIAMLIIENNAVSLTCCLLTALVEKKIKVVFCDGKHSPQSELVPYYGAHNCSLKIRQQMDWDPVTKREVWTSIVSEKIRNQSVLLQRIGKDTESEMLDGYLAELEPGDITNREGHAAKVYFNAIFGMDFTRNDEENPVNAALNYGYAILLSAFNREVVANGYLTQLGIAHENQFNYFNLSCDLMEPFRVVVDERVVSFTGTELDKDAKHELIALLNKKYDIGDREQTLLNAIKIYTKSVLDALNEGDPLLIKNIVI